MKWAISQGWMLCRQGSDPAACSGVVHSYKNLLIPTNIQLQSVVALQIIISIVMGTTIICLVAMCWPLLSHSTNEKKQSITPHVSQIIPATSEAQHPLAEIVRMPLSKSLFFHAVITSRASQNAVVPEFMVASAVAAKQMQPDWHISIQRLSDAKRFDDSGNRKPIFDQQSTGSSNNTVTMDEARLLDIETDNDHTNLVEWAEVARDVPLIDFRPLQAVDMADVEVE